MKGQRRRVLLVGGGHTHIEVLRQWGKLPMSDADVALITPYERSSFSGMIPGLIAGHYTFRQAHIPLEPLCKKASTKLILTQVKTIVPSEHRVECADGRTFNFDFLSLDVGSDPSTHGIPGALKNAASLRNVPTFLESCERFALDYEEPGRNPSICVVGSGAGGVELALALKYRLSSRSSPSVSIVGGTLLADHSNAVRRSVAKVLKQRNVALVSERVVSVDPAGVTLSDGRHLAADFVVLATGPSAPTWIAGSGFATDDDGYVSVDRFLRSVSHPEIFASGDIATNTQNPAPKSGVYAVRAAPILAKNLRAAIEEKSHLQAFNPQRTALFLIASGDKHATLSYGPLAASGRWVCHLKSWIDRRFIRSYS